MKPFLKAVLVSLGILAALVVLGVAGRNDFRPDGTVTAKYHDEPKDTAIWAGKVLMPYTAPECWGLTINDSRNVCVEKPIWDQMKVGDHFNGKGVQ